MKKVMKEVEGETRNAGEDFSNTFLQIRLSRLEKPADYFRRYDFCLRLSYATPVMRTCKALYCLQLFIAQGFKLP